LLFSAYRNRNDTNVDGIFGRHKKCAAEGHDVDAIHCKKCGAKL